VKSNLARDVNRRAALRSGNMGKRPLEEPLGIDELQLRHTLTPSGF
ncbi:MAG: hypothetical protein RJA72_343, partial [Pseudomonadota bacterium]